MSEKAHVVIDVSNFVSWFSLLKITQVFGELQPLDILEIQGADSDTKKDLLKVLPKSTYHVLPVNYEDDEGFHQFQIQKRG